MITFPSFPTPSDIIAAHDTIIAELRSQIDHEITKDDKQQYADIASSLYPNIPIAFLLIRFNAEYNAPAPGEVEAKMKELKS
jgi:hypothetical protein